MKQRTLYELLTIVRMFARSEFCNLFESNSFLGRGGAIPLEKVNSNTIFEQRRSIVKRDSYYRQRNLNLTYYACMHL